MHRHCCIVVGRVKLENWHLFVYRQHAAVKNAAVRWMMWDRLL